MAILSCGIVVRPAVGRLLLGHSTGWRFWDIPKGVAEAGEDERTAAVRECFEETGLLTRPQRLIGVFGGVEFLIRYPNGDLTYYNVIAFEASVVGGKLAPDGEEIAALRFVDRTEWEELPISPPSRIISRQAFARDPVPFFVPASWQPET